MEEGNSHNPEIIKGWGCFVYLLLIEYFRIPFSPTKKEYEKYVKKHSAQAETGQLMKLLIEEVTVLLLDEPSNDIVIATLETLENIINSWENIVLYISHDETLIENTANKIIHIEKIHRKTKASYSVAKVSYRKYIEEVCKTQYELGPKDY